MHIIYKVVSLTFGFCDLLCQQLNTSFGEQMKSNFEPKRRKTRFYFHEPLLSMNFVPGIAEDILTLSHFSLATIWGYYTACFIAKWMRSKRFESCAHDPRVAESKSKFKATDLNSRTLSGLPATLFRCLYEPRPERVPASHLLLVSGCILTASSWPGDLREISEHRMFWKLCA